MSEENIIRSVIWDGRKSQVSIEVLEDFQFLFWPHGRHGSFYVKFNLKDLDSLRDLLCTVIKESKKEWADRNKTRIYQTINKDGKREFLMFLGTSNEQKIANTFSLEALEEFRDLIDKVFDNMNSSRPYKPT